MTPGPTAGALRAACCGHDAILGCLGVLREEGVEIVRIFSARPTGVRRETRGIQGFARRHRIPIEFRPIRTGHLTALADAGVGLLVVFGYPHKVPAEAAGIRHALNVHPSLLPEGRGPWPLPIPIAHGHARTGVTLHKLADRLDAGDVLAQAALELAPDERLESLECKAQLRAAELLRAVLRDLPGAWARAVPQGEGSYWPMPTEADRTIRWSEGVAAVERRARAYGAFGALARWDGRLWRVGQVVAWPEAHRWEPGRVVHRTAAAVVVAAADGLACVSSFRPPSLLGERLDVAARLAASHGRSAAAWLALRGRAAAQPPRWAAR